MTTEILLPMLSPTMTKGNLAKWLVGPGDEVKAGDVIAEVETDKVTVEIEAQADGYVAEIRQPEGTDDIPVDSVIAVLSDEPVAAAAPAPAVAEATPVAVTAEPEPVVVEAEPIVIGTDVDISPLARRIAQIGNLDLSGVKGSGAKGRIVKRDVEKALGLGERIQPAPSAPAAPMEINTDNLPEHEEIKLSGMRNVIASRLTESSRDIPHFYMTVDCHIDQLLAVRKQLNEQLTEGKISVNDMLVKAVAVAFSQVPKANMLWAGDKLLKFSQSDIAIAVAIDDGLITPVIKDATNKGLSAISNQAKAMVEKARKGQLAPQDYQGGTFTISNLGMYGIKEFTSIINPPHNGILSVGAAEKRPVVVDDELKIATVMSLTLAMDHRAVDGATGAELLQAIRGIIEQPFKLML